jgi:antitoxin HicB
MKRYYPARIQPAEEGGYILQFHDLEEAFTQANSIDELMVMAEDVLEAVLESRLELNLAMPEPSKPSENDVIIAARVSITAVAA